MNDIYNCSNNGIILNVHVRPGASGTTIAGVHDGKLKLRVQAEAVDGSANRSLCAFLAQAFGVTKSSVTLLKGEKARHKQVFISGDAARLERRLLELLSAAREI